MSRRILASLALAWAANLAAPGLASSQTTVDLHAVSAEGIGEKLGTVQLSDSDNGLVIQLSLTGLLPGPHGFHLHENPSCDPAANQDGQMAAALGAGGHYDPAGTGKHMGPSGDGHLGDLPVVHVLVDEDGALPVVRVLVAPRLTVADTVGRALVIHESGDNYRDEPKALGGGGARIACAVVG